MPTLHIEHPITDLDTWATAFNRLADARRNAGVKTERIQCRVDNPNFVVIDLDFDSGVEAHAFLQFLETQVWGVQANSPALAGTPETMLLEAVGTGRASSHTSARTA